MKHLSSVWRIRLFFWVLIILLKLFAQAPYDFMALNTFLGYVPIELSFHLKRFNDRRALAFWLLLIIWLIFYPNAPYVMTDLFHLSWLHPHTSINGILRSDPVIWLNFAMMMVCALACLLVGTVTLDQTARQLTRLTTPHQPRLRYLWIVIFMTMASIGIYIGRFLRLHSIYLLFTPTWSFRQLWSIWSGRTAAFVAIMTILQLIVYWLLKVCQHFSIDDNK
ncbi:MULTISPECIES: DUF1361 domain-containing protein [Limosilactobacillus]|uniref:DUF1361 domain-containing protein n=1 Tax=Limosilactobacillus TaxID=2742598 RepID=UPI002245C738|nr:DUF1361 domain-containing protein [Limosilactobacillus pontis]MCX2186927.1 DUF1361 domain-containing protein [Limosilactobacillus pontis]MCX2188810.1 DUF1361 domain-containing protein [Limosilactobacillus pontis]